MSFFIPTLPSTGKPCICNYTALGQRIRNHRCPVHTKDREEYLDFLGSQLLNQVREQNDIKKNSKIKSSGESFMKIKAMDLFTNRAKWIGKRIVVWETISPVVQIKDLVISKKTEQDTALDAIIENVTYHGRGDLLINLANNRLVTAKDYYDIEVHYTKKDALQDLKKNIEEVMKMYGVSSVFWLEAKSFLQNIEGQIEANTE